MSDEHSDDEKLLRAGYQDVTFSETAADYNIVTFTDEEMAAMTPLYSQAHVDALSAEIDRLLRDRRALTAQLDRYKRLQTDDILEHWEELGLATYDSVTSSWKIRYEEPAALAVLGEPSQEHVGYV